MLGMHLMLMIGEDGQYFKSGNNPNLLPDFMVFLGHTLLPTFWKPFYVLPLRGCSWSCSCPALLALVFGFLAFRSRIKGVYFSILTQALTYGAALMFFRNDMTMGGNNGFTDFKRVLGADMRDAGDAARPLHRHGGRCSSRSMRCCRWLTRDEVRPRAARHPRLARTRVLFSGYAAANYKLFIFVVVRRHRERSAARSTSRRSASSTRAR